MTIVHKLAICSPAAILLLPILFCGCTEKSTGKVVERETRVTVQPLEKRIFRHQIPVQGTVTPVDHAVISAKISGTLEMLNVSEGDECAEDAVLFGIDRQVLKNQVTVCENEIKVKNAELQSSRIALEDAEITLKKAKIDYERFAQLWEKRATSKAEYESYDTAYRQAEMQVKSAQAEIANAEAQLKQAEGNLVIAQKNLTDSVVRAPFHCIVTDKYVEQSEYVSVGQNILKLENHDNMEVECYISSVYYGMVTSGITRVEFLLDGEKKGEGVVTYKAPNIDPQSRTFKLKALLPDGVELVSGTLCELNIILEEKEAYGLPSDALLLRANDRYIAYGVDEDSRAESFEIERGIVDSGYSEVVNASSLLSEKFVVTGQTFINNGSLLRVSDGE